MQFGVSQQTKKKNGSVNASHFPTTQVRSGCWEGVWALVHRPPRSRPLLREGVPVALIPLPRGGERHGLLAQARTPLAGQ